MLQPDIQTCHDVGVVTRIMLESHSCSDSNSGAHLKENLSSSYAMLMATLLDHDDQEAPYNMILQVIGTDGVLIASMVRASLKGGGLSQWHFYYVPLYMVSCIPHVLAASLSSVAAMSVRMPLLPSRIINCPLTNGSSCRTQGVGAGDHVKFKTVAGSYTRQTPDAVLAGRVAQKKHGARKGYHLKEVVPRAKDKLPDSSTDREVYAHYTELNEQQTRDLPRFKLALIVKWTFLVHLLLWCGVFAYLYLGNYAGEYDAGSPKEPILTHLSSHSHPTQLYRSLRLCLVQGSDGLCVGLVRSLRLLVLDPDDIQSPTQVSSQRTHGVSTRLWGRLSLLQRADASSTSVE